MFRRSRVFHQGGRWTFYTNNQRWKKIDPDVAAGLDQAVSKGAQSFSTTIARQRYTFDLSDLKTVSQKNLRSKRVRDVQYTPRATTMLQSTAPPQVTALVVSPPSAISSSVAANPGSRLFYRDAVLAVLPQSAKLGEQVLFAALAAVRKNDRIKTQQHIQRQVTKRQELYASLKLAKRQLKLAKR
jgi:hypothetical protein